MQTAFGGDFGDGGSVADEFEAFGVGGKFDDAPFGRDDGGIDEIFGDSQKAEVGVTGAADVFKFTAVGQGFQFAVEFFADFAVIWIGGCRVVPGAEIAEKVIGCAEVRFIFPDIGFDDGFFVLQGIDSGDAFFSAGAVTETAIDIIIHYDESGFGDDVGFS